MSRLKPWTRYCCPRPLTLQDMVQHRRQPGQSDEEEACSSISAVLIRRIDAIPPHPRAEAWPISLEGSMTHCVF